MRKLEEPMLIAIACAVIAMFIGAFSVLSIISLKDFEVSAIVRMSGEEPLSRLARSIDPSFQFVFPEAHYDGVYYYAIALDPFATKEAHELIDLSAYRYSHPGYGWAAWLASLGQPRLVPSALLAVGLSSVGLASLIASIISARLGWSPWGGLVVALNPGVIYAVSADTGEAFALVLLGLLILAWRGRRWIWVTALTVALCMTKEIFLLVSAALFLWKLIEIRRGGTRDSLVRALLAVSAGPVTWALWQVYLFMRFDGFSLSEVPESVFLPFQGWMEAFSIAAGLSLSTADSTQVGQIAVPLIAAVGTMLLLGIIAARRLRTEIEVIYLFLAVFTFCLGPLQIVYPKELLRLSSTPLILLPAVIAAARREPLEA